MRLVKTCNWCPEQYDVFQGKVLVGYLRMRWGHFQAYYMPDGKHDFENGEVVYVAKYADDLLGEFPTEGQRHMHLKRAQAAIRAKLEGAHR